MTISQRDDNSQRKPGYMIHRTAIDSFGRVGSLYDACSDRVIETFETSSQGTLSPTREVRQCKIVHGSRGQYQNILQMADIDDDSRLSIILNLSDKQGLAAIMDYAGPIDEYTRLFCYTYIEYVQKLSNNPTDIRSKLHIPLSTTKPTHIITNVEWGIDVVVVLRLPNDNDTIIEIDRVLQQICTILISNNNSRGFSQKANNTLGKIIETKVFSNMYELTSMNTFYDVCAYIEQNKNNTFQRPVSYKLKPITWLYPHYTGEGSIFVSLTTNYNYLVEHYVTKLLTDMGRVTTSSFEHVPKMLTNSLKGTTFMVHKRWHTVYDDCIKEIQRLSKLIYAIRSGRTTMSQIDEALKVKQDVMMQNTLHNFSQFVGNLEEKGHFIRDLEEQGFRYVNGVDYNFDKADNPRTIERKVITNNQYDRVLCSSDILNMNFPEQLRRLRNSLSEESELHSNLRLVYADFSYCTYELQHMMILPFSAYNTENNKLKRNTILLLKEIEHATTPLTKTTTSDLFHAETFSSFRNVRPTPTLSTKPETNGSLPVEVSSGPSLSNRKSETTTTSSTKPQTNATLPVKSDSRSPLVDSKPTSIPTATSFTKSQINISLPVETRTPRSLSTEKLVFTPTSTKTETTTHVLTARKILTNNSLSGEMQSPVAPSKRMRTPDTSFMQRRRHSVKQTTSPSSISSHIEQQTQVSPPLVAPQTQVSAPLVAPQTYIPSPKQIISPPPTKSPRTRETINILLLGETGVGKSTFINAFANYLTFNTLERAEKDQPVVLIPASFLITVGENFDEYIVKFGNANDTKREDFTHPGQSVTQQCKSYEFNLNRPDGKKLCIIDTPGLDDTRGLAQDDRNMEHILNYMKNLTHLNAICFLLKPNESRLNNFYRSCFMQLTSFLKANARDNTIFCFTNARSAFYAPGDTSPLLRQMLNSLPMNNISFKKENTFCFDSESFRYLVALKNDISFTELKRKKYEMGWRKSVAEANRLIQYICDKLTGQLLANE